MLMMLLDSMTVLSTILLILGFVLVGIEMVIPGFSLPGITGIICLVASVFLSANSVVEGTIMTIIIIALLGIMLAIILWLFTKGKFAKPLILTEEQNKEYISSGDLNYLLGKKGVAMTDLRPSGIGEFEGITLDVISESKYITAGTKIVIKEIKGSKLIVKPL